MRNESDGPPVRLFVALPVPAAVACMLAALPRTGLTAKWTHGDDYHITLRFLGDLDRARLAEIRPALTRVRRAPFHVDINGLGVFDNKRQAILHAHIESTRKLTALCGDVTDVMTPLGFDFGFRPFVPHITLARLNRTAGLAPYINRHAGVCRGHWLAEAFALMESGGAEVKESRYSVVERYPLIS